MSTAVAFRGTTARTTRGAAQSMAGASHLRFVPDLQEAPVRQPFAAELLLPSLDEPAGSGSQWAPAASGVKTQPAVKLRLTRRGRFVFFGLPVALILGILLSMGIGAVLSPAQAGQGAATQHLTITVKPGDTLWSIAESSGLPGDIRDVVGRIASLNGIKAGHVEIGQSIYLPSK